MGQTLAPQITYLPTHPDFPAIEENLDVQFPNNHQSVGLVPDILSLWQLLGVVAEAPQQPVDIAAPSCGEDAVFSGGAAGRSCSGQATRQICLPGMATQQFNRLGSRLCQCLFGFG